MPGANTPKEHLQPRELFESEKFGFSQVVVSGPGKLVFVSGQTAWNREYQLVGEGDLRAQTEQALENLGFALQAAGAKPADVTSLRIYVVDYEPAHMAALGPPLRRFFQGAPPAAQTLLGVQALGVPGLLVEIEATAALES